MHFKTNFFQSKTVILFLTFSTFFFFSCKKTTNLPLEKGMVISESVTIQPGTYVFDGESNLDQGVILIEGENIIVDFQEAVLQGSNEKTMPNEYKGIGVLVKGENIEIKNLNVHGYQVGLKAEGVNNLKITNSDFSYNYCYDNTQDIDLTFDKNTKKMNPMAGIHLQSCNEIEIKNNRITNGNDGLLFFNCENGKIYNNTITHNSSYGILLIASTDLNIMHNYLDWNNGATINASYQSKNNTIAFNSLTHSKSYLGDNTNTGNDFFPFENPNPQEEVVVIPYKDGQKIDSLKYKYRGEKYILKNEWGPYNFEYPTIWLREVNDNKYTFAIFGPEGNWKVVDGTGFVQTSRQSGAIPATLVATTDTDSEGELRLDLEFIGVEFTDQFGNKNKRGKTFKFGFNRSSKIK